MKFYLNIDICREICLQSGFFQGKLQSEHADVDLLTHSGSKHQVIFSGHLFQAGGRVPWTSILIMKHNLTLKSHRHNFNFWGNLIIWWRGGGKDPVQPRAAPRFPSACVGIWEPSHTIPDCLALDQRYSVLFREPVSMIKGPLLQLVGRCAFFTTAAAPPLSSSRRRVGRTVVDMRAPALTSVWQ